jgi:hypothetical protein
MIVQFACSPVRPAGGMDEFPKYKDWDAFAAATQAYPITKYQDTYFVAVSLADAKERMRDFCASIVKSRGFRVSYSETTQSMTVIPTSDASAHPDPDALLRFGVSRTASNSAPQVTRAF